MEALKIDLGEVMSLGMNRSHRVAPNGKSDIYPVKSLCLISVKYNWLP